MATATKELKIVTRTINEEKEIVTLDVGVFSQVNTTLLKVLYVLRALFITVCQTFLTA